MDKKFDYNRKKVVATNGSATKECYKCKKTKPVKEFYKHQTTPGGYENQCKACRKLLYVAKPPKARKPIEKEINRIKQNVRRLDQTFGVYDTANPPRDNHFYEEWKNTNDN